MNLLDQSWPLSEVHLELSVLHFSSMYARTSPMRGLHYPLHTQHKWAREQWQAHLGVLRQRMGPSKAVLALRLYGTISSLPRLGLPTMYGTCT
jgi:hypothetical protein